jgi:RNA polymerase sigma-70 factor, ECF subfamily
MNYVETNKSMIKEKDILLAREYHKESLAKICEIFYPIIYRYIYMRINNEQEAQDLTHEVFIKMVKNIEKQSGRFEPWLFTIAKNIVTDYYRKHAVRKEAEITMANELKTNANEVLKDENVEIEIIKQKMQKLPEDQQQVVILKFINDMTNERIAKLMKRTVGAVKSLQFRAVQNLRKLLMDGGE